VAERAFTPAKHLCLGSLLHHQLANTQRATLLSILNESFKRYLLYPATRGTFSSYPHPYAM